MRENWMESAGMVVVQARRLRRVGFSVDELYTVGLWGLYQAAQRFDPAFGDGKMKFENFAELRVRGEIIDWMDRNQRKANTGDLVYDQGVQDRGMAAVDAIDSLEKLGIDPGDKPPRKPDDLANSFRGRIFTADGKSGTLAQWSRLLGFHPHALKARILKHGEVGLMLPRANLGRKRRAANNPAW